MKKNANPLPISFLFVQRDLEQDNRQLLVLVLKRSGILSVKIVHKVSGDKMAEKMLEFAESGHPVFRATSPLSRGQLKSKGHGKLSIHYCADLETIQTVFRTIVSVNQLSLHGAVEKCVKNTKSFTIER